MEIGYYNRSILSQYDLDVDLFREFNIEVCDLNPSKNCYILFCEKGKFILKQLDYGEEKFKFICRALEYTDKNLFKFIKPLKTKDGDLYKQWKGKNYIILPMDNGVECDINNHSHIILTTKAIADMHKASKGILNYMSNQYYDLIKWNSKLTQAIDNEIESLEAIKKYKEWVTRYVYKNEFDKIFLDSVDYYIQDIKESVAILKNYGYEDMCRQKDTVAFCHGDLGPYNVIIKDDEAWLLNFHLSNIDLKISDLSDYIYRVVRNYNFDFNIAKTIMETYTKYNNLREEERQCLYGFLRYPCEFFYIVRDYYEKRVLPEEGYFLDKLVKSVNTRQEREEFLNKFQKH